MDKKYSNLPLRSGVGIVVLNKENKVFVAKRIDNPKDFWQMPQGGVDSGEDFLKAAYRELEEETSIKSVKLIKELEGMITYELPERLLGIIWKGKYRGQKQKWFLLGLESDEESIVLNKSGTPEFDDWRWVNYWYPVEQVIEFKRDVYRSALEQLQPPLERYVALSKL